MLNPGTITVAGKSAYDGSGILNPYEFEELSVQTFAMHVKGRPLYNWLKHWRKKKVNTLKFRSIIRNATIHKRGRLP